MKTKVILFVGAVAVVTLSFTFAGVKQPAKAIESSKTTSGLSHAEPAGGIFADVVE